MTRVGVYPGSFDPPTRAHLEIAVCARRQFGLTRIDLAISTTTLGKDRVSIPRLDDRLAVIRASVAGIEGLGVVVTDEQLIVDISDGYDVVVMGADKWTQINDPRWYGGSIAARDAAIAGLPDLAVAPRPPHEVPDPARLLVAEDLLAVSSTAARAGRVEWMTEAARTFDARTGAWTDPGRYR